MRRAVMNDKIEKSDAGWRDELTPEQYQVCRCKHSVSLELEEEEGR